MPAGRPTGSVSTETRRLKLAVIQAFDKVGGVEYLVKQSKENPSAFIGLIKHLIPAAVKVGGDDENPNAIKIESKQLPATHDWIAGVIGAGAKAPLKKSGKN